MKLLVGLGNPGTKYAGNRHNIGFLVVDEIHRRHGFSAWRKKFQGQIADGQIDGERVLLLKPETFMNESGRSLSEAARFHKIKPADVVVFHDELDLAPGKVRAKVGGGHAGHNGLRSIVAQFDKEFVRVRLGIGHPGHKDRVAGYVLSDFAKSELNWLQDLVDGCAREAGALAKGNLSGFQTAIGQARSGGAVQTGKANSAPAAKSTGGSKQPGQKSSGRPAGPRRPSQRELAARAAKLRDATDAHAARTKPKVTDTPDTVEQAGTASRVSEKAGTFGQKLARLADRFRGGSDQS